MPEFAQRSNRSHSSHLVSAAKPDRTMPRPTYAKNPLLSQQRVLGNQAVQRLAQSCPVFPSRCPFGGACHTCPARVQAKLTVNKPSDKYEQEADRVADQVMRMPEPRLRRQVEPKEEEKETLQPKPLAAQIMPLVQRQVDPEEGEEPIQAKLADGAQVRRQEEPPEEEEEELIRTKQAGGKTPQTGPGLEAQVDSLRGGGRSLPESARNFFELRFGYDFSQVRVHTGARAAETARTLNARAYTVGRDIVFGPRHYAPETVAGKRLLAHELTHVVQQRATNRPLMIQRQPVRGVLASRSELIADGFNWRLWENNLSSGRRRPFIHGGLMVSGKGYAFGIKFLSNCPESLVQTVVTRTGFFGAGGRGVRGLGRSFVELFRVQGGQAVGIDQHTHPTPSPRFLARRGIRGAVSHCLEKELAICCGNFAGLTVPRGRRGMTRRYRPQDVNCRGPQLTYRISYCTNSQDFSLRVTNFPIDITSFVGVPRRTGPLATISFTVEMQRRLDRHGIPGTREVERYIIINPAAKEFVQNEGVNGAEALFHAQGDVAVARRFLSNLANVRIQYDTCLAAVISRPQRTPEQWSVFVRRQLRRPEYGLCRELARA